MKKIPLLFLYLFCFYLLLACDNFKTNKELEINPLDGYELSDSTVTFSDSEMDKVNIKKHLILSNTQMTLVQ